MPELSSKLYHRCRSTLLNCTELDSDHALRAVFAPTELRPFRNRLIATNTKNQRVDAILDSLIDWRLSNGRPALVPFLKVLCERYQAGDALHDELRSLSEEVQAHMSQSSPAERLEDIPDTVLIRAGRFCVGNPADDPRDYPGEASWELDLPQYSIGRYPITNAEYARFLAENPSHPVPCSDKKIARPYNWHSHLRTYPKDKADHPVVLISWKDANAYCRWLSQFTGKRYRLPTEEEWEKAARGGFPETRRYPWGDEWKSNACNTSELKYGGTTPVHTFEETSSPFGVVDLVGNVWEWTSSSYESEQYGRCYIIRGGSWQNSRQAACIYRRGRYPPGARRSYLGFRVVLESRTASE